jgi:crotonobetaine/carnitine-CoA ligase
MDLETLNVRRFLERAVRESADEPFLIFTETAEEFTYAQADELINRAADAWHGIGVRKGDRVAFMVDNSPMFIWAWLGLAKIGGVLVAVNTGFLAAEAGYVVGHCRAAVALVDDMYADVLERVRAEWPGLTRVLTTGDAGAPSDRFAALMAAAPPRAPDVELRGDDLISLIYTSGTTGEPKGVMQTHRNYVLTGQAYGHWMRMSRGERIYACLPLFHINSQAYSTMGAIGVRGALVLAPRFGARRFWPEVRRHRVNVFNFIGAMTVILVNRDPAPGDRDHAVHTAYGVPALPADVVASVESRFGLRVVSGFGMSETTFGLLEPLERPRRSGTMGVPRHHPDPAVPRTRARVVDPSGRDVGPGRVGELLLRNAAMMAGYFCDNERTAAALAGGWLHTGDSAYVDRDGYFYFVDRIKDIIRRRGENISSIEVEQTIARHPMVAEVAVVGVPSELSDEDVMAFVVKGEAELTAEMIFEWTAGRLAPFKVPRYVRFVGDLPKTPTNKVRKRRLRDLAAADPAPRHERRPRATPSTPT